MRRVFLKTELENPLRQLALEQMLALSDSHCPIKGKIDVACSDEEYSFAYSAPLQAVGLIRACEDVSMLSITDERFCLLLDKNDTGVELSYVPLEGPHVRVYADIVNLSKKILTHLEAIPADPLRDQIQPGG